MTYSTINLSEKFGKFAEYYAPRVVAEMNDYQFKLVKLLGEFTWHSHDHTDEVFIVVQGQMRIEFRDSTLELKTGEMFVVPKGVEHKPVAERECHVMLVEPRGVVNTGEAGGALTALNNVWV